MRGGAPSLFRWWGAAIMLDLTGETKIMATDNLRARLRSALGSGPAQQELISAISAHRRGPTLYVDGGTGFGSDTANNGNANDSPFATMTGVMNYIGQLPTREKSDGMIVARGYFAEHVTAPLGAYGWILTSGVGGRPHHATNNGVVLVTNGCDWRAAAGGTPLLDLREQGWMVSNILFTPQASYGAIRLHREETATYPDASHAIISGCRFYGPSTQAGIAIDDYGAGSHCEFSDNEFEDLEFGYKASGVGISAPNRHNFLRNSFHDCKNDIVGNFYGTRIENNRFRTVYHATTHPNTVNMAYTADSGLAANSNQVIDNTFEDTSGNVTIAKGYKPATGDNWNNRVFGTAALIVAVPT